MLVSSTLLVLAGTLVAALPQLPRTIIQTNTSGFIHDSRNLLSKSRNFMIQHPTGREKLVLFHGTRIEKLGDFDKGVILDRGGNEGMRGDFHSSFVTNDDTIQIEGGFYLTDSLATAAQFACYRDVVDTPIPWKVAVLSFSWSGEEIQDRVRVWMSTDDVYTKEPGSKAASHGQFVDFNLLNLEPEDRRNKYKEGKGGINEDGDEALYNTMEGILIDHDMISGPMTLEEDLDLTPDFWQYAIIRQATVDARLKRLITYEDIYCDNVPRGDELNDFYDAGKIADPSGKVTKEFEDLVKKWQIEPKTFGFVKQANARQQFQWAIGAVFDLFVSTLC
ncbi:hypothetical protein DL96DRAFT_597743 [Flagelloscypha sp. PMI_526]|nr:hypothetical protein DL96DRAFT_597743 [Flagelloscypha sp. PMI_526]